MLIAKNLIALASLVSVKNGSTTSVVSPSVCDPWENGQFHSSALLDEGLCKCLLANHFPNV